MNLYSLVGLIALIAIGVTIVTALVQKPKNWFFSYLRNFLGTFFIFSGVVKAIDPMGTAFKMKDYFSIFTEYFPLDFLWDLGAQLALPISVFMIVLEIALGVALILGTLPKITLGLYAGLILFFTFLTGFSAYTGKVTDCGCFGDFVKLKPIMSFYKDIFLTVLVILVALMSKNLTLLTKKSAAFVVLGVLTLASLGFCMRNINDLPIVDFRAYKVGTDLNKGRSDEGLDAGETKTVYTLNNATSGETKKIDSKEYMDSGIWKDKSWSIDKAKTETVVVREPELPKIKDFFLFNEAGDDDTDSLMTRAGYQFFVTSYDLSKTNPDKFKDINAVMSAAKKEGVPAIGITSGDIAKNQQLGNNLYQCYNLDAIPIKTMMRSNPGVLLIKDGVVKGKYHYKHIPEWGSLKKEFGIR